MTMFRLSEGFVFVAAILKPQNVQTGSPARPQGRKNRRRTLLGTSRSFSTRDDLWVPPWSLCRSVLRSATQAPASFARPARARTVVCRNSLIMSSTHLALDLIAIVQGAQP